MTENLVEKSRSGRVLKRRNYADFQQLEDELEMSTNQARRKKNNKSIKRIRRYQAKSTKCQDIRRKTLNEIPTDPNDLKKHTDSGVIPDTIYYRATNNSMYIPSITADMIQDNGMTVTVLTSSDDYFKYSRVRQTTKNDHADPEKVLKIIDAVKRKPIIWDQRLLCHHNLPLVRRAWQQLEIELGMGEEYPLARCKQIWKSKKDYFAFAVNTDSLGKWIFTDAMEFYRPMVNFRSTVCLRPTVSADKTSFRSSTNLRDKLVLADKNIKCTSADKTNVLTYILKSLHETGMSSAEMMEKHGQKILDIFRSNLETIRLNLELN